MAYHYAMKNCIYLLLLSILIISACSPKGPYALTNKVYKDKTKDFAETIKQELPATLADSTGVPIPSEFVGTVNFGIRKPNYVIIHFTAQDSVQQTLKTFTVTQTQTSAHYVIAKNGKVFHMVNDYLRANHAGLGKWGSVTDMNSCSIGIEIDNNSHEPFTGAQVNSLLILLAQLKKSYNIPQANFIGHMDLAPTRKNDPSRFPWKKLADQGFGFWYEDYLETPPADFSPKMALRIIGYDVSNLDAAIKAFKIHYIQQDVNTAFMSENDLKILYSIYKKFL